MDKEISQDIRELFRIESEPIAIYLKSSHTVGTNFDPFRNTGKTKTVRNPIFIKAIVSEITPEKLIIKEMGLTLTGAKSIVIKSSDVGFIKFSEKIVIKGQDYYKYSDAVGNKLLIYDRPFNLKRVIIFIKEK